MTKLHFNYKDVFRSLRLGFSAKKVWMMFLGLLAGFAGYSLFTYLAYAVAGQDFLPVWETYRLLPFPDPLFVPFPWYAWAVFALGPLAFIACSLFAGTAVSKVTYEQLRGDEFFESREAFRFAFRHAASVLGSPLLLLGFVALVVVAGLILGALGAIPFFGEIVTGVFALPALAASFFIVYLFVVLFFCLLLGPSIVGATRNDTFDTIFEVFSCVNEQPARLVLYLGTAAGLAKAGAFLFSLAMSAAGRIGYWVLGLFMGTKLADVMSDGAFYFKVSLPSWSPEVFRSVFEFCVNTAGLPQVYLPSDYVSITWAVDIAALFMGASFYVAALLVVAYGCSVWYTAGTLTYAVLAQKKDEKNILKVPDDEEELLEPVVPAPEPAPPAGETPGLEPGQG